MGLLDFFKQADINQGIEEYSSTAGAILLDVRTPQEYQEGHILSDGTLWEVLTALYFRWTCLPDCAVPELDADYRRNNRRLS